MSAKTILTVDLGYGDAGKGSIVDWLTSRYNAKLVVRFNGGAQAAHNVVMPDGRHHTFAQFGSGSFHGTPTYLSRFVLVTPENLLNEARHLEELGVDTSGMMFIHKDAPITTPFHKAANRIKEIIRSDGKQDKRHGSCGMGIGETATDVKLLKEKMLYLRDLSDIAITHDKLTAIQANKREEIGKILPLHLHENEIVAREWHILTSWKVIPQILATYQSFLRQISIDDGSLLSHQLASDGTVIFEAAQGVLLDEEYAFFPYATHSKTTLTNACAVLKEASYSGQPYRLGITRAYSVRHGAGPMITECDEVGAIEDHNSTNPWQRHFRSGWFDAVATRYAIRATGGIDGIALTCLDKISKLKVLKIANQYQNDNFDEKFFDYTDRLVQNIRVLEEPNLQHQHELTQQIMRSKPVYTEIELAGLQKSIEDSTGVPLVAESSGMTSDDKVSLLPF